MSGIMTIGYQGKNISEFIETLQSNEVDLLVDVRLTPISRKKGFSKTALRTALADAGIGYLHLRELGNPKEFRSQASSVQECLDLYTHHMAERWDDALQPLEGALTTQRACLMCFEHDPTECHRGVVSAQLASDGAVREVVHL